MNKMHIASLAAPAGAALLLAAAAEAKYTIRLTVEPLRPIAGHPVRVIVRTEVALAKRHDLRLNAVGPWRDKWGLGFFEARLVRVGPQRFRAALRFPYPGRWRLIIPNWGAPGSAFPPPVDRAVTVRPQR